MAKPDFKAKAHQGLHRFLSKLKAPAPSQQYFSVAIPGRIAGVGQDAVWVDGLKVAGETVEGRVVSVRPGVQTPTGKRVKFQCDDVCDWMIVDDSGVEGAYSLR